MQVIINFFYKKNNVVIKSYSVSQNKIYNKFFEIILEFIFFFYIRINII